MFVLRNSSQISLLSRSSGFTTSSRSIANAAKNPVGERAKGTDKVFGQDQPDSSDAIAEKRLKDYTKGHQAEGTQIPGEFKTKKVPSKDQSSFVSNSNPPNNGQQRNFSTTSDIKKGAQNVAEAAKEGFNIAKNEAKDAMNSGSAEKIKDTVQQGYNEAKRSASNVSTDDLKGAAKVAVNKAYNAKEDIKREADRVASNVSAESSGVVDTIKSGIASAAEAVKPMATKGYQAAKDAMNSETAQNIKEGAKGTAKAAWEKVSSTVSGGVESVKQQAKEAEQKNKTDNKY